MVRLNNTRWPSAIVFVNTRLQKRGNRLRFPQASCSLQPVDFQEGIHSCADALETVGKPKYGRTPTCIEEARESAIAERAAMILIHCLWEG